MEITPYNINDEYVNLRANSLQPGQDDVERNGYSTSFIRKIITRVSDIRLEQSLWRWKANSKIYKVMFHEIWLILMFTRSKQAAKSSLESMSSTDSSRPDMPTSMLFYACFCLPVRTKGMPHPNTLHRFIIPTLIHIFIRFRVWRPINKSL